MQQMELIYTFTIQIDITNTYLLSMQEVPKHIC